MAGETRAALELLRTNGMTEQMAELAQRLGYRQKSRRTRPAREAVAAAGAPGPSASAGDVLAQARGLVADGAYIEAIGVLDSVGVSSPDYAAALALRGEASEAQGDLTSARWAIEAALRTGSLDAALAPVALHSAQISLRLGDTGTAAARIEQLERAGVVTDELRGEVDQIKQQLGEGPYFRPRVLPRPSKVERQLFPPARPRSETPPPEEITGRVVLKPPVDPPVEEPAAPSVSRDEFAELLRSLGGEMVSPPNAEPLEDLVIQPPASGARRSRPAEEAELPSQSREAAFMSWPSDNEPIEMEPERSESERSSSSVDLDLALSRPLATGDVQSDSGIVEDPTLREFTPEHDRYEFKRKIGAGGMGVVFEAIDVVEGREVVVKLLQNAKLPSDTAKDLFLREAMVVAYLDHPNIVAVHDFGHMGDHPYIAMEYVRGTDLRRRVRASREQRLPTADMVAIFEQVSSALDYAHEQGIVHRDIKLSNVMVTDEGVAKLLDFGIARAVDAASSESESRLMGTPLYMAPELIRREEYDHRVDIYAMGVALYRVLTGVYPFQGKDVLKRHLRKEPQDPLLHNAELPMALGSVILRCLEKSALNRFQTAGEVGEALRAAVK